MADLGSALAPVPSTDADDASGSSPLERMQRHARIRRAQEAHQTASAGSRSFVPSSERQAVPLNDREGGFHVDVAVEFGSHLGQ